MKIVAARNVSSTLTETFPSLKMSVSDCPPKRWVRAFAQIAVAEDKVARTS